MQRSAAAQTPAKAPPLIADSPARRVNRALTGGDRRHATPSCPRQRPAARLPLMRLLAPTGPAQWSDTEDTDARGVGRDALVPALAATLGVHEGIPRTGGHATEATPRLGTTVARCQQPRLEASASRPGPGHYDPEQDHWAALAAVREVPLQYTEERRVWAFAGWSLEDSGGGPQVGPGSYEVETPRKELRNENELVAFGGIAEGQSVNTSEGLGPGEYYKERQWCAGGSVCGGFISAEGRYPADPASRVPPPRCTAATRRRPRGLVGGCTSDGGSADGDGEGGLQCPSTFTAEGLSCRCFSRSDPHSTAGSQPTSQ